MPALPVLPIPMIIALLLFGFLTHRLVTGGTHISILALMAACATQGAIIALVQHYGVTALRPVQALMAMTIPPLAWAAFRNAAGGDIRLQTMLWHTGGLGLAIFCLAFNPFLLDLLIPVSFAAYGAAMLFHLRRGEDSLLHSRLESGFLECRLSHQLFAMSQLLMAWRKAGPLRCCGFRVLYHHCRF
jgi:hypothetical protein